MAAMSDLLNQPPPITRLLIELAPYISSIRHLLEISSWKSRTPESWIALVAWWTLCLTAEKSLRYFLPLAFLACLPHIQARLASHQKRSLATEETLSESVEDVARIQSLIPSLPNVPTIPPPTVARIIAIVWIPYLILVHLVRLRVLVALFGTVFLTWRSPWSESLRTLLFKSAVIRMSLAYVWAFLSGVPAAPHVSDTATLPPVATNLANKPGPSVRFLFTIHENQRWWVGLDWTAALLPGERPSWCSASQLPLSPPSVFTLPASTTIYSPAEGPGRIKRTGKWSWEENEWKVVVRTEVAGGVEQKRLVKQPPTPKEDQQIAPGKASKVAGKISQSMQDKSSAEPGNGSEETGAPDEAEDSLTLTDSDGWVYFDNKWEGGSNKGGIGKFTRCRRWTRVAILTEVVEHVGPGDLGVVKQNVPSAALTNVDVSSSGVHAEKPTQDPGGAIPDSPSSLRQRLKAAVRGAS